MEIIVEYKKTTKLEDMGRQVGKQKNLMDITNSEIDIGAPQMLINFLFTFKLFCF